MTPNQDYEDWARHERCVQMDTNSIDYRFCGSNPVEYSHNANVAESFAKLGSLLHAIERQLREAVEGTWEERELCFQRFCPETHELALKAAEAVAEFKRQLYAEGERYKELNRENGVILT